MKAFFLLLLIIPFYTNAQTLMRQTLAQAGSGRLVQAGGRGYFLLQSVGQGSVTGTYTAGNASVRQGYIQPLPILLTGGDPDGLEALVWPNPFVNGVVARLEAGLEEEVLVQVFDISGRLVQRIAYVPETQLAIPLLNLSQGIYFIRFLSGQKSITKQLIKL
ncbi:T9SS type A sorting domain-containing protein [Robiginitalea marina]|uniref:T9SS type A sorting domain-containing protein n=1 Tax=Robiginitalea marina TaxID=2954105 RepID=A0ABT1AU47_9FLAO|nr:T9SS type A sorting domain-containing protein [Robiginitalea marina]MCO5723486.1 T9SS type A sorting domain-containing protein [Robiginitalea marina]